MKKILACPARQRAFLGVPAIGEKSFTNQCRVLRRSISTFLASADPHGHHPSDGHRFSLALYGFARTNIRSHARSGRGECTTHMMTEAYALQQSHCSSITSSVGASRRRLKNGPLYALVASIVADFYSTASLR